jgi:hypothetical protein
MTLQEFLARRAEFPATVAMLAAHLSENSERAHYLRDVPVRFFIEGALSENLDAMDGDDLLELSADAFEWHARLGYLSEYERDTVRENGVSQIVLTLTEPL